MLPTYCTVHEFQLRASEIMAICYTELMDFVDESSTRPWKILCLHIVYYWSALVVTMLYIFAWVG